jgi:hypothetical protein
MPAPLIMGAAAVAARLAAKKAASNVVKKAATKKAAAANARGLKAANKSVGVKYKKGLNENNWSGRNESKPKQVSPSKVRGIGKKDAPYTSPSSYKESRSGYNTWAKKNPEVAKANPPSGKFAPRISRSEKVNKKFK